MVIRGRFLCITPIKWGVFQFSFQEYNNNGKQTQLHSGSRIEINGPGPQVLRCHHYAMTTERTYCIWILRFIHHFDARRHPRDMGA